MPSTVISCFRSNSYLSAIQTLDETALQMGRQVHKRWHHSKVALHVAPMRVATVLFASSVCSAVGKDTSCSPFQLGLLFDGQVQSLHLCGDRGGCHYTLQQNALIQNWWRSCCQAAPVCIHQMLRHASATDCCSQALAARLLCLFGHDVVHGVLPLQGSEHLMPHSRSLWCSREACHASLSNAYHAIVCQSMQPFCMAVHEL